MKGQPVIIAEKGQPVVIVGYMDGDTFVPGLPDSGGGGDSSAPIVKNITDLNLIENPVDNQIVAVLETNTFWQYDEATSSWEDTEISYIAYYGGQVAETTIDLIFQDSKTDEELIELFGVISDSAITVDQSSVSYSTKGVHPVTFKFAKGRSITCFIRISNRYTYDLQTLKYNCKLLPNSSNFIETYALPFDFSNFTVKLNGAGSPVVNGNRHEWYKRELSNINKVQVEFTGIATLKDGSKLNGLITFGEFEIHPKVETDQKWGFDVIDGNFVYLGAGFVFQKVTLEVFKENGDIVYLNIASRIDNVNYAKHVGSDVGISEFFVSENTLLLAETYSPADAELPIFIASRYEGDGDISGDDRIALGIVKQDTTSITFVFGKDYTGSMLEDGAALNYLDFPVIIRAGELVKITPKQTVYREAPTATLISEGGLQVLMAIPAGTLKSDKTYKLEASAKYKRTGGNSNPSNIEFSILQGATVKIKDFVTVFRDTTANPIILNIPSIVKRFNFTDDTQVVVEARVPTGQVAVTISDVQVRFTEVDEVEDYARL